MDTMTETACEVLEAWRLDAPKDKGGRRSLVTLDQVTTVIRERAEGKSCREAGEAAGVPRETARNIANRNREEIDGLKEALTREALNEVLANKGRALRARLKDAEAEPGESKTAPSSLRVAYEACGVIGGRGGPLVNIDQRSMTLNVEGGQSAALRELGALSPAELDAQLEQRMAKLSGTVAPNDDADEADNA